MVAELFVARRLSIESRHNTYKISEEENKLLPSGYLPAQS